MKNNQKTSEGQNPIMHFILAWLKAEKNVLEQW